MAGLNDEGQWIILMALLVCVGLFFIAIAVNESTLVGRTTAESVLDFPKSDIQDIRSEVLEWMDHDVGEADLDNLTRDVQQIAMTRSNAQISIGDVSNLVGNFHYNDGVTDFTTTIQR